MATIQKYEDGNTSFSANKLNIPILDIQKCLTSLESKINNLAIDKTKILLENQPLDSNVTNFSVVYHNGLRWEMVSSLVQAGNELSNFPLGAVVAKAGSIGSVQLFGVIEGVPAGGLTSESVSVGVPYFLSANVKGKLTSTPPSSPIFVGYFMNATTFILNIQLLHNTHVHRKIKLSQNWVVDDTELLYPINLLPQIPLPFEGVILSLHEGQFEPSYGDSFYVDLDGLHISDVSGLETITGAEDLLDDILNNEDIHNWIYYSEPKTLQVPGVSTLTAKTSNLIIENNITGTPVTSGSLNIKNIPTIRVIGSEFKGDSVIKSLAVDSTTGEILVSKGKVIESIIAGTNIVVEGNKISSTASSLIQTPFNDVSLKGALSRRLTNSLTMYVEFISSRQTSAIYTTYLPTNKDTKKLVTVYGLFFSETSDVSTVNFIVNYTEIGDTDITGKEPIVIPVAIPFSEKYRLVKVPLLSFSSPYIGSTLAVEVVRLKDEVYQKSIGVTQLISEYYIK